jgi:hypothetical protein
MPFANEITSTNAMNLALSMCRRPTKQVWLATYAGRPFGLRLALNADMCSTVPSSVKKKIDPCTRNIVKILAQRRQRLGYKDMILRVPKLQECLSLKVNVHLLQPSSRPVRAFSSIGYTINDSGRILPTASHHDDCKNRECTIREYIVHLLQRDDACYSPACPSMGPSSWRRHAPDAEDHVWKDQSC